MSIFDSGSWFGDNILGNDPSGGGINTVVRDPLQIVNDLVHNPLGTLGRFAEGITLQGLGTLALYDYLKPNLPDIPPGTSASFDINGSGNLVNIPVIYGIRKISATVCPIGVDGNDLYVIALLCEGEISAINTVYLDDAESTDPRFTSNSPVNVHITKYLGTDSQAADATLIAKFPDVWTSAHQLKGLAYLVVKLTYDPNIFSAMPVITAEVEGKKVYDPRENLLTHSEEFNNAIFGKTNCSVSADIEIAPNGNVTADSIIEDSTSGSHFLNHGASSTDTTQIYAFSIYAKRASGSRNIQIKLSDGSGSTVVATFDLANGVIHSTTITGNGVYSSAAIAIIGSGWYRCELTGIANSVSSTTLNCSIFLINNLFNGVYTGDGSSSIYVWGAQLNLGALKAYAKTTTAAISPQTAYSANPALCIRDYLTNSIYGKGLDSDFINDDGIIESAEICDAQIEKYNGSPAPQMNQFECNAAVDTSQAILDNLKTLLQSCRGFISYYNGLYNLRVERDEDSVFDFTTDNMSGTISVANGGKANRLNRVTINYNNEAYSSTQSFVDDACIYDSSELRADDNNSVLENSITMPAETSKYRVLWHAFYYVKRSRLQITCGIVATPEALICVPGNIVTVTYVPLGWSQKKFRITAMTLRIDCMVEFSLIEHDSEIYDRTVPDEIDDISETTLPDPFTVAAPTGLTLASGSAYILVAASGTILPRIYASWTAAEDPFVSSYELQWKVTSDTVWHGINPIPKDQTGAYIGPLQDGIDYTVRVRTVNSAGRRSDWGEETHTVADTHQALNISFIVKGLGVSAFWNDAIYKDSVYCVISSGTHISTSSDGAAWTAGTIASDDTWLHIAATNTLFCTIGFYKSIISSDGEIWTTVGTLPTVTDGGLWNAIAANDSLFCIVANGGLTGSNGVATSTDGVNWTLGTMPATDIWGSIIHNGSIFCAVGATHSATSTDGVNWTLGTMPATGGWEVTAYGNGVFVACGGDSIAWSDDGLNWTNVEVPVGASAYQAAFNNSIFCAISKQAGVALTSFDGKKWYLKEMPVNSTNSWNKIISDGIKFFIIGDSRDSILMSLF